MRDKVKRGINLRYVFIGLAGLILVGFGVALHAVLVANDTAQIQKKYSFIAKRTLIDNPNDIILDFSSLKTQLQAYITEKQLSDTVSLYFEYLPTGTSIGFNENEELVGASLLKTPLAINLYKMADQNRIDLDKPIPLKKEWLNSQYGDLYKKGEGYQLTLREATKVMLEQSDNTAALMIYDSVDKVMPLSDRLLQFIDIEYGVNKDESIRLGSEMYSSILKCLYFSCYTDKDSSQEILKYLSSSTANNRLLLYLPKETIAAHKIGTYDATNEQNVQSDCGIFYLPQRNYLLCVMVKGEDPESSRIIGDISKTTHNFVNRY